MSRAEPGQQQLGLLHPVFAQDGFRALPAMKLPFPMPQMSMCVTAPCTGSTHAPGCRVLHPCLPHQHCSWALSHRTKLFPSSLYGLSHPHSWLQSTRTPISPAAMPPHLHAPQVFYLLTKMLLKISAWGFFFSRNCTVFSQCVLTAVMRYFISIASSCKMQTLPKREPSLHTHYGFRPGALCFPASSCLHCHCTARVVTAPCTLQQPGCCSERSQTRACLM